MKCPFRVNTLKEIKNEPNEVETHEYYENCYLSECPYYHFDGKTASESCEKTWIENK